MADGLLSPNGQSISVRRLVSDSASQAGSASQQAQHSNQQNIQSNHSTSQNNRRPRNHDRYQQEIRYQQSSRPDPDSFIKNLMGTMSQDCKDVLGMLLISKHLDVNPGELNTTLQFVRDLRTPRRKSMEEIIGGAIEKHVEVAAQYKGLGLAMKFIGAGD